MMKKRLFAAMCVTVMAVSIVGCGGSSSTSNTTAAADQVVNPVTEYKTVDELKTAIGFTPLELPSSQATGMKLSTIEKIDTDVAELEYESTSGNKDVTYIVRTVKDQSGAENVTGMYGAAYTKSTVNGKEVHQGKEESSYVAYWMDGDYTYVLYGSISMLDENAFHTCLEAIVK